MSLRDIHPALAKAILSRALRARSRPPGRPRDPTRDDSPREMRSIRVTEEEWQRIELLATEAGLGTSEWIRKRALCEIGE